MVVNGLHMAVFVGVVLVVAFRREIAEWLSRYHPGRRD